MHTKGPVPVWGRSIVAALVPQRVLEMLDKIPMPRQKQPSEVNLVRRWLDSHRPNQSTTYSRVEVHVQINQVCKGRTS